MRPLALAVSLALVDASAHAATITVTDGGDSGSSSTCTLRQAVVSANKNAHGASSCADGSDDDMILFDDALVGSTITLGGTELAVTSPMTIIGSGQTIDGNNASRVMYVGHATLSASHLKLVNGNADGNSGGGMEVLFSTVSLDDVGVSGNEADYAAGIAAFNYSALTVTNSTISGNVAARKGGGVEIVNGTTVKLANSVVSGNTASRGAGIFLSFYSELSLERSTISGNTANSAPNLSGGGIYGYRCTKARLIDSTISANSGNYSGGGIVAVECPLAVVNSTVANNTSLASGGGMYIEHGTGALVNATVSGNSARDAGGI